MLDQYAMKYVLGVDTEVRFEFHLAFVFVVFVLLCCGSGAKSFLETVSVFDFKD